jgi:hypothetical protein
MSSDQNAVSQAKLESFIIIKKESNFDPLWRLPGKCYSIKPIVDCLLLQEAWGSTKTS